MTDHVLDKEGNLIPDPEQSFPGNNDLNPPSAPTFGDSLHATDVCDAELVPGESPEKVVNPEETAEPHHEEEHHEEHHE